MTITWKEWILHVLLIGLSAWLIISGFSIETMEAENINGVERLIIKRSMPLINQLSACIGIALVVAYGNIYLIFNNFRKITLPRLGLFSIAFLAFGILLSYYLPPVLVDKTLLPPLSLTFGIPVFYYTLSVAYTFGKIWWTSEQQRQQLLLDKKQAELSLLRNQLQPHFLFNALNNLLALVDQKQSPLLASSFDRLSQLLRYVIDGTQKDNTTIDEEIEFIRHYAALQLLRFEPDEVNFNLEILGKNTTQTIEPGLFIPFVENAFKYGTEPENVTEIKVTFDLQNTDQVIFKIRNKVFSMYQKEKSTGTGIPSTKKRLQLIYPDKHQLKIDATDYFYVELKIITV